MLPLLTISHRADVKKNCLYSVESEYNNHNIKIRFNRAEATETANTYK